MTPQEQLELTILGYMLEETPSYFAHCWFMPIRYIEKALDIDFAVTRGFLHSLRTRGLVEYGRGFDEDGMVAGSGYTVTMEGEEYHHALEKKPA